MQLLVRLCLVNKAPNLPDNLSPGDVLHVVWVDLYEQTGEYVGFDRGYLLIRGDDGKVSPCYPNHLKEVTLLKRAKKPNNIN